MTEGEQYRYHGILVEYIGREGRRYVFETPSGAKIYVPYGRLEKDLQKIFA